LLDGLEAVELRLSEVLEDNLTFRIDSEFYKKELILFYENISNFSKLGSFVKSGYRVVYENTTILDIPKESESEYTRFLQASDIQTPEIVMDKVGFVSNDDWERYPKGHITKGELLIEVKGKAEKVAIVYDDVVEKMLVSGSLFKLTVNDDITKEYLLSFLLCKYGTMFKDRSKTNLLISYISKPDLYNIPVPITSKKFQLLISESVNLSHKKIEQSKTLYKEAENLLLEELGLLGYEPSVQSVSVKSFSQSFGSSGRLDSEYYLPKYETIIKHITDTKHKKLSELVHIHKSIEPGSNAYQKEGIPFVRVSNLTKFGLSEPDIHLAEEIVDTETMEKIVPKRDTILLSKDGTVGIAYAMKNERKMITSGAILHLTRKDESIQVEYLTLVLNSMLVQMQSERDAGGSIIKHWKPSEIAEVLIPVIDMSIQTKIEENIKTSFTLKEESKALLERAKRAVEVAIEEGEDVAMGMLGK